MSLSNPSLQTLTTYTEEGEKRLQDPEVIGDYKKAGIPDTHMHSEIRAAHTRPAQVQARQVHSPERRRWTWAYIPHHEAMCK